MALGLFYVSGCMVFGFRVERFRVSGFRVSGFRFRDLGFPSSGVPWFWVSESRVFWAPGFTRFRVWGSRVSRFRVCLIQGFCVQGLGVLDC